MNDQTLRLLLCTNGAEETRSSLEYGVWLAQSLELPVLLLGIIESPDQSKPLRQLLDWVEAKLKEVGLEYEVKLEPGQAEEVVASQAARGRFFTVIGPFGRPVIKRFVYGRSVRRILEKVATPVFYVRDACLEMKRILVCSGGLDYSFGIEHVCIYLAQKFDAQITLLHVVEPVTLQYPLAEKIDEHWKEVYDTDTALGRNLRKALEEARRANVPLGYKIRHGTAVREILEEMRTGGYHLLGMGSHYSAHSLRHLYLPNVTAEVAEASKCPVLTVRQGYELVSVWLENGKK